MSFLFLATSRSITSPRGAASLSLPRAARHLIKICKSSRARNKKPKGKKLREKIPSGCFCANFPRALCRAERNWCAIVRGGGDCWLKIAPACRVRSPFPLAPVLLSQNESEICTAAGRAGEHPFERGTNFSHLLHPQLGAVHGQHLLLAWRTSCGQGRPPHLDGQHPSHLYRYFFMIFNCSQN